MTHHLVGLTEIGAMLGVSRQRAAQIVSSYDDFPSPEAELSAGRVWARTAVEAWIRAHPDRPSGRAEGSRTVQGRSGGRFEEFTDRARDVVVRSQEEARLLNHNYIGTEHLLLGLLAEPEGLGGRVLRSLDVTADEARSRVEEMIGVGTAPPAGHIPFTPRAKKVLELALREAHHLGHVHIGTEHVLLGLIREGMAPGSRVPRLRRGTAPQVPSGVAPRILVDMGVGLAEARQAVLDAMGAPMPADDRGNDAREEATLGELVRRLDDRLRAVERKLEARGDE